MSNYKGFDINTNTTPAPWGAREQQMVQDQIDTLVGDAILASKDTTGHKHGKVYDPAGNVLVRAETNALGLACNSAGAEEIVIIPNQVELVAGQGLIGVTPNLIEIRSGQDIQLDNFNQQQYLYTDTGGVVHQGPLGVDASHNNAFLANGHALQFTKDTSYIMGNTNGDIAIETTDSDINIQQYGTSSGNINITNTQFDINIHAESSGKVSIIGSSVTIDTGNNTGNNIILPTIPSSSAGLTTGMLWVSSGGALMRMA